MKERIIELVAEFIDCDAAEVDTTLTFEALGLDSLDLAELAMQIENEFNLQLDFTPEINTIDKVMEQLEK